MKKQGILVWINIDHSRLLSCYYFYRLLPTVQEYSRMYLGLHAKCPYLLSDSKISKLSRAINKCHTQNITKIRPASAGFFVKGRRTDVTKPVVTFRNFANSLMSVAYTYFPDALASDIRH